MRLRFVRNTVSIIGTALATTNAVLFLIVFLADPQELAGIYADIGTFTSSYLARA